jgi:hypothetical protein
MTKVAGRDGNTLSPIRQHTSTSPATRLTQAVCIYLHMKIDTVLSLLDCSLIQSRPFVSVLLVALTQHTRHTD